MEIIHLILGKCNPQRMNGVNKVVNELATRQSLAAEKVQVWGITPNPVHDYPEREYLTRLYKKNKNPFVICHELKHDILRKRGKAVFHLHGGFVAAMYSAAMWLKRNDIPFVFTPHGSYNVVAMRRNRLSKMIYFGLFERRLLKAARTIHSLGKSEIEGLQTVFKNTKSVLIPYGFEVAEKTPGILHNKNFIVGYCGRLDIYTKGLKELLEGFNGFRWVQPHAVLWIIGDGAGKGKLIEIANDLQLGDKIIFHGPKYGLEKDDLLKQCDVFVAPSRNEGLPTAVLEAASFGVPCLVTEATNTGDYITAYNAGVVIGQTSATDVSNGLKEIANHIAGTNQTNSQGENARTMIAEAFDWNKIVTRFHKLYHA